MGRPLRGRTSGPARCAFPEISRLHVMPQPVVYVLCPHQTAEMEPDARTDRSSEHLMRILRARPIDIFTITLGSLLLIFARTWAGPPLALIFVSAALWWPFQTVEQTDSHPGRTVVHDSGRRPTSSTSATRDDSLCRGATSPITSSRPTHLAV